MKINLLHSWRDKTTRFFDYLADNNGHSDEQNNTVIDNFHRHYYDIHFFTQSESNTVWRGVPTEKCPLDLWIFQEIIFETKPELIIECGTGHGGTTLFLADFCESIKFGNIISIDKTKDNSRPVHQRISYLQGLTISEESLSYLREKIKNHKTVMVILDDDHHKEHVLKELIAYSEFVSKGNYLIVEDTNLNGNPVYADFGQGPKEAVEEFLRLNKNFTPDRKREKYFLTFNPDGYLLRI